MKFKERFQKVLQALKMTDKAKNNELTADDWKSIEASYKETHDADLYADMKEDKEQADKAKAHDEALKILADGEKPEAKETTDAQEGAEDAEKEAPKVDLSAEVKKIKEENASLKQKNEELDGKVEKLSKNLENDNPKTETVKITGYGRTTTKSHLFGIENDMFSLDKRYNKLAVVAEPAQMAPPTEEDVRTFQKDVNAYGKSLAERFGQLQRNNLLNPDKLMATELDITDPGTDFGNYFVVRRQDALIAQILKIRTFDFLPTRYGIQDMETIMNVLFTEVSQGWQKGKVFKGSADVQPETGHVDDVSIKLQFEPLKKLERNYLGYLNTEGSDAIKWGMIEWYALNILTVATQEETKRSVLGCAVKPETGTAGYAINASTGLIYTLIRYFHQNKLNPFADTAYASYTSSNMYATVKAFLDAWVAKLGDQDMGQFTLLLNARHKTWWLSNIRTTFGLHSDFAGPKSDMFPDYELPIYWVPAEESYMFMVLAKAGNLQKLRNVPGEIMALKFSTDFEDVLVRSNGKEGVSAAFVGPKFSTNELLVANDYVNQQIFMNKPATVLGEDVVALNGATNFWFVTGSNTGATAITDLPSNPKNGQVFIVECGSLTNATAIAKSGSYAGLTAAWTPTAVGDYIMFTLDAAGTGVRELERCVGGTRSVNSAVQPTLPEARS